MSARYSKKHYEDVASILKDTRESMPETAALDILFKIEDKFIKLFKEDNGRFDEDRFKKASGRD